MKKILFCAGLLALSACSTPSYVLTTDIDELARSQSVGGEVSQSQYPTWSTYSGTVDGSLKELLIPVHQIDQSGFQGLGEFLYVCNMGKFKRAKEILAAQKLNDPNMKIYLDGLLLFLQKKHTNSIEVIRSMNSPELALQNELLMLDNEYELQKKWKKIDKSYFIRKYQDIIDTYSLEKEYTDLINARIKSLRYS